MPVNRNALIRYRTIDNCLRNKYRKWTLEDLIEACSEALYEYEGIDKGVSRRSIQMDLQMMRSEKLGYNAPIVVLDKKYYAYEDPDYSITNIPLTDQDLGKLTEVVEILRQFKGFTHFQELNGMVQRLGDRIHTAKTKLPPIIDLEKNEHLKGLEFIDCIYQAILNKKALTITYQSFKAREAETFTFHAYLLKEYRNRWFMLGTRRTGQPVHNLALDRIIEVEESREIYLPNTSLNLTNYYEHVVGVSVNQEESPEEVVLFTNHQNAPYVLTKPIHHSQQLVERNSHGIIIRLQVQLNYELEREILGFGDCIKVLKPERLKRQIYDKANHTAEQYRCELHPDKMKTGLRKLHKKGSSVLENMYTRKELSQILLLILRATQEPQYSPNPEAPWFIGDLLRKNAVLKEALFNSNLCTLLKEGFGEDYFLTNALCLDKPLPSDQNGRWHQDVSILVKKQVDTAGFQDWMLENGFCRVTPPVKYLQSALTVRIPLDDLEDKEGALKIIPHTPSHILTPEEIRIIQESTKSKSCQVPKSAVHLMHPLTLHTFSPIENDKRHRVIHLEFNNKDLPGGLEWLEKERF